MGEKLYQIWLGSEQAPKIEEDYPFILVGNQISVSDIANLATEKLAGIVCFAGGSLSHIAVFANALGIPAIMGIGNAPIQSGDLLIVDGESATLIHSPNDILLNEYKRHITDKELVTDRLRAECQLPAITKDSVRIALYSNSGLQADVMPGIRNGAEGIGLYRTEIPFMLRSSLPSEYEQEMLYRSLLNSYDGKPVYFRVLDIGADKPLSYMPDVNEENPALGWRGIRFMLDNIPILVTQVRALIKAAESKSHVHVLLPMISSTEQLDKCAAIVDDAVQQLMDEGYNVQRPKLGIMVEVPSCIALLPFWRDKLDFISIGTNDLSQYLLALDRNSPLVGKLYDSLHPSVLHELKRIIDLSLRLDLPVSVCGEMASDPIAVVLLVAMGVRKLSMSSTKIPMIKWVVREISLSEAQEFLNAALIEDTATGIRQLGSRFLESKQLLKF